MRLQKIIFYCFIFLIPFEIYTVHVGSFVELRFYQIAVLLLLGLVGYRYARGQISAAELLRLFRSPMSRLFVVFVLCAAVSLWNSPNILRGVQETLVLISFLVIYWVTMFHVNQKKDLDGVFYVALASSLVTALIALAQVVAYKMGLELIEVMPGRPNSILPEPDWLGFFMVFSLVILLIVPFLRRSEKDWRLVRLFDKRYLTYGLQALFFIVIILTIARASWLAATAVIGAYLLITFIDDNNPFLMPIAQGVRIFFVFLLSLGIIYSLHLTPFSLKNRALSIVTGQEVHAVMTDPETGKEVSIKKSEIENYTKKGIEVKQKKVEDINISRRTESFTDNFDIILKHPLLGIGFGGIETVFGKGVNANNIFMEVWIATGTLGLIIFLLVLYCLVREWVVYFVKRRNRQNTAYLLFVILGLVAMVIPNMFNSGLFLGFFWIYLGLADKILTSIDNFS